MAGKILQTERTLIHVDKELFTVFVWTALRNVDLSAIDNGCTGGAVGNHFILHKKDPCSSHTPAHFQFMMVVQIGCFFPHLSGMIPGPKDKGKIRREYNWFKNNLQRMEKGS